MFRNLERELETFQIEAISSTYLIRASVKPFGELPTYLNDRRRDYIRFEEVELQSLSTSRQMQGMKREVMSVNKPSLYFLSLTTAEEVGKVQLMSSKRAVVFYMGSFIVRGQLHINPDASNEDLLDEARDFYPISEATVFPLETLAVVPVRQVPLLFVNRPHVQVYHIHQEE